MVGRASSSSSSVLTLREEGGRDTRSVFHVFSWNTAAVPPPVPGTPSPAVYTYVVPPLVSISGPEGKIDIDDRKEEDAERGGEREKRESHFSPLRATNEARMATKHYHIRCEAVEAS